MKPLLCFAVLVLTSAKFGVAEEKKAAEDRDLKSHDRLESKSSHVLDLHPAFQQLANSNLNSDKGYAPVFNKASGAHVIDLLNIQEFSDTGGPRKTLDDYAKGQNKQQAQFGNEGFKIISLDENQQGQFTSDGYKTISLGGQNNEQAKFTSDVSLADPIPSFDGEYYKGIKNLGLDEHRGLNSGFGGHSSGQYLGFNRHNLGISGVPLQSGLQDYKGLDFGAGDNFENGYYAQTQDHHLTSEFGNEASIATFGKGSDNKDHTKGTTLKHTNTKHTSINLEHIGKPVMDKLYGGTVDNLKVTKVTKNPSVVKLEPTFDGKSNEESGWGVIKSEGKHQWEILKGEDYSQWGKPEPKPQWASLKGEGHSPWGKPEDNLKADYSKWGKLEAKPQWGNLKAEEAPSQKPKWEAHIGNIKASKPSGASVSVLKFDEKTKTYVDSTKLNFGEIGPHPKNPYPNKPVVEKGVPILKYEILHKKPSTEDELLQQAVDSGAAIIKHVPIAYAEYIDKPHPLKIYVEKPVLHQKIIKIPYKVEIPKPVIVEKKVPYPVKVFEQVAKPYPVYKDVPIPKVVYVDKPVPKYVEKPYPVKVIKPKNSKSLEDDQKDLKNERAITWDEFKAVKASAEEKFSDYYKSDEKLNEKSSTEIESSKTTDDHAKGIDEWKSPDKSGKLDEDKWKSDLKTEEWKTLNKASTSSEPEEWKAYSKALKSLDKSSKSSEEESSKAIEEWKAYTKAWNSKDKSSKALEPQEWKAYTNEWNSQDKSSKASEPEEWKNEGNSQDKSSKPQEWNAYNQEWKTLEKSFTVSEPEWKNYNQDKSSEPSEEWKVYSKLLKATDDFKGNEEWKKVIDNPVADAIKSKLESSKSDDAWKSIDLRNKDVESWKFTGNHGSNIREWKAGDYPESFKLKYDSYNQNNLDQSTLKYPSHVQNTLKHSSHDQNTHDYYDTSKLQPSYNQYEQNWAADQTKPDFYAQYQPAQEVKAERSQNDWKSLENPLTEKHYEEWKHQPSDSAGYHYPDFNKQYQESSAKTGKWSQQISEVSEAQTKPSGFYQEYSYEKPINDYSSFEDSHPGIVLSEDYSPYSGFNGKSQSFNPSEESKGYSSLSQTLAPSKSLESQIVHQESHIAHPSKSLESQKLRSGKSLQSGYASQSYYPGKVLDATESQFATPSYNDENKGSSLSEFKASKSLNDFYKEESFASHQNSPFGEAYNLENYKHNHFETSKPNQFENSEPNQFDNSKFKQFNHNQFSNSALLSFTPSEGKDFAGSYTENKQHPQLTQYSHDYSRSAKLPLNSELRHNNEEMLKSLDVETSASEHITTKKQLYPLNSEEPEIEGGFTPIKNDTGKKSSDYNDTAGKSSVSKGNHKTSVNKGRKENSKKSSAETTTVISKLEKKRGTKITTTHPSVITMESGFVPIS